MVGTCTLNAGQVVADAERRTVVFAQLQVSMSAAFIVGPIAGSWIAGMRLGAFESGLCCSRQCIPAGRAPSGFYLFLWWVFFLFVCVRAEHHPVAPVWIASLLFAIEAVVIVVMLPGTPARGGCLGLCVVLARCDHHQKPAALLPRRNLSVCSLSLSLLCVRINEFLRGGGGE